LTTLHCFNVGNGDCLAIELDSGQLIVVDAGPARQRETHPLTKLLAERRLKKQLNIDVLCLSHPDADHGQQMPQIMEEVLTSGGEIGSFLTGPLTPKSIIAAAKTSKRRAELSWLKQLDELTTQLKAEGRCRVIRSRKPKANVLSFAKNGTKARSSRTAIHVLSPDAELSGRHFESAYKRLVATESRRGKPRYPTTNPMSLVLLLARNSWQLLFTGDVSHPQLGAAIKNGRALDSESTPAL
jgi:hypothetical protein